MTNGRKSFWLSRKSYHQEKILAIYFEEELLLKQKPSQLLVRQFALHLKRKSSGILLIDYLPFWDRNNLGKVVFLHNLVTQTKGRRYQIYVVLGLFDSPVPKKKRDSIHPLKKSTSGAGLILLTYTLLVFFLSILELPLLRSLLPLLMIATSTSH